MTARNVPEFVELSKLSRSRLLLKITRRDHEKIVGIKYRYGASKSDPYHPLIIRTPKISAPHGAYGMVGGYNMILSLGPIYNLDNGDQIELLRKALVKLDQISEKTINDIRDSDRDLPIQERRLNLSDQMEYAKTVSSYVTDTNSVFTVNFDGDLGSDRAAGIFDENRKPSDVSILQGKCIVSLALELTAIVFVPSRRLYRLDWKVLQIRRHRDISPIHVKMLRQCYLDDEDDEPEREESYPRTVRSSPGPYAPPPPEAPSLPGTPWTGRAAPPPPPPPSRPPGGFIAPSIDQLQEMLGKLKSTAKKSAPWEKDAAKTAKVNQEIEFTTAQVKQLDLAPKKSKSKKSATPRGGSTKSKSKRTKRE